MSTQRRIHTGLIVGHVINELAEEIGEKFLGIGVRPREVLGFEVNA